jgi:hypothetical protein
MARIHDKGTRDEVVQEVRRIKEALAESMGFDIHRILEDARRRQHDTGRTVLPPPARRDA